MKRILQVVIVSWCVCFPAYGSENDDIDRILAHLNQMNQFSEIYSATVKIATFEPGKEKAVSSFKIYVKGVDQVLLNQLYPTKDKHKKILMRERKIWFYFPRVKKAILINARNTLFGTVSVGDVLSPPLLSLYQFRDISQVQLNQRITQKLEFQALDNNSPFGKMIYYFQDDHVVASESYTRSGIFLKKAEFGAFIRSDSGMDYASKIKIVNQINPNYYSLIQMADFQKRDDIPSYFFMVEGLDRIDD